MKAVYDKNTKSLLIILPDDQDPFIYYKNFDEKFLENIEFITIERVPRYYKNAIVVGNEIIERVDE